MKQGIPLQTLQTYQKIIWEYGQLCPYDFDNIYEMDHCLKKTQSFEIIYEINDCKNPTTIKKFEFNY